MGSLYKSSCISYRGFYRMKKIAVIGTHSVGKSTFCYKLALEAKRLGESVHIVQERVRFSPCPINEKMTQDTCYWACTNQISKEIEATQRGFSIIICDRSPLDTFAYARYNNIRFSSHLEAFATAWLRTYDTIYFIRPSLNHIPSEDGIRSTNTHFINSIDIMIKELLDISDYPYITVFSNEILIE